jgi:hypothetical protein
VMRVSLLYTPFKGTCPPNFRQYVGGFNR